MRYLPEIFSLIVAAAGWFYMFYSRAASNLAVVESQHVNRLRVRLRRLGGFAMILLAAAFYAGSVALERRRAEWAAILLLIVLVLMCVIVALGLLDLRLTNRLRRSRQQKNRDHP
jgi:hypothetical protein